MKRMETRLGRMACDMVGEGGSTIVIDAAICSCGAEWRHIAAEFMGSCRVVTFDRTGYGASPASRLPATPEHRAKELRALLDALGIERDIVLFGHSQGGLYAAQYALQYPETVKGLVLLDPATPFDDEFKAKLTPGEYRMSGVDKTGGYRLGLLLSSLGIGFLFKPLLLKSPPFYYHSFTMEEEREMLASLTRPRTYRTALAEYRHTHSADTTRVIVQAISTEALGNIPVRLITHSGGFYVEELKRYAGMDEATARKVDDIWQEIMRRYLGLSSSSLHIDAPHSGHFIHLTDFETVRQAVLPLL